jgi:polyvinyl alcohol dehydrogenase (cytochrome)
MNRSNRHPLFLIALAALIIVVVAVAAYLAGVNSAAQTPQTPQTHQTPRPGQTQGQPRQQSALSDDWPAYMYDGARSGFNAGEVRLSPENAANLKLLWKQKLGEGNVLAAQPIVKGDTVYVGSWDGFLYALSTADGSLRWKVDLGKTHSGLCTPDTAGITSAPAVTDDALYIGGGDEYLYALNPRNGQVIWKFRTGDNSETGGAYNWASPVVYNGRVYYGIASFCDRPFVQGEMWGLNARTGKVEQRTIFVPDGQRGGGIWTSPTVDEATGAFYVTTGSGDFYIPHSYSIARLDPRTLAVVDAWQIPMEVQVFDGDWGTTPTLFRHRDGYLMVGASAKNGYYYAFRADDIASGPMWQVQIADGGPCPQCGEGAISSSAYAYDTVYVAAGYVSLGQFQRFAGTVHALDPSTGARKWIHPTSGWVIPALAVANGLVVAAGDDTVEVLHAATGELLWEYATEATIYAAPTIAGGTLYVASTDGHVYAFSAQPYPDNPQPYEIQQVGSNPPNFTPFRKPVPAPPRPGPQECFPDTGKCVRGDFLQFWQERGGLERFGPAVTDELNEAGRTVQYFRNAVLEIRPRPDGQGTEVRFTKLDYRLFTYKEYQPEDERFQPAEPLPGASLWAGDPASPGLASPPAHEDPPTTHPIQPGQPLTGTTAVYFRETRHNLPEPFLSFWRAHGEVAGIGYPVSEPFDEFIMVDGAVRRVQYFERARLEIVKDQNGTERVAFGALGLHRYLHRYGTLP